MSKAAPWIVRPLETAAPFACCARRIILRAPIRAPARVKNFEAIPTLAEQGMKGFEADAWQGVVVPAKKPPEAVAALNRALLTAPDSTPVKAPFQTLGLDTIGGTPQQVAANARAEGETWGRLICASRLKLD